MFNISLSEQIRFRDMPESGMGYQRVEAVTWDSRTVKGLLYNGSLLSLADAILEIRTAEAFSTAIRGAKEASNYIRQLRLAEPPKNGSVFLSDSIRKDPKSIPASQAPQGSTASKEIFKRFSAFPNDIRVTPDGRLRPGSYATTESDATNVKTGAQAVARYALPNPKPANNIFTIRPDQHTPVRRGVAQPAYGQPGGGVEVLFDSGTSANTVTGPATIPEK